ncbi:hypothetical protein RMCBS344292_10709 [Rhizopus microsporus]|nr:hypothetical protein RMCBS344292_10709 [Rhizopus microsporus]
MLSVKKEINWPMQFIVVQNPTCIYIYPKGTSLSQCLNKVVKCPTVSDFLLKRDNTEKPENDWENQFVEGFKVDVEKAVGHVFKTEKVVCNKRDYLLYALGVGVKEDELQYLYELRKFIYMSYMFFSHLY